MNNKYNKLKYYENRDKILSNRKNNYKSKKVKENNIYIVQETILLNFD